MEEIQDTSLSGEVSETIPVTYSSDLIFDDIGIKDGQDASIRFQGSNIISANQLKVGHSHIIGAGVPIIEQTETISTSTGVLVNSNNATKVVTNQTILPLSIANINSMASRTTLVPSSQSNALISHALPIYQTTSFDGCDTVLDSPHNTTGQTFLLTSPNQLVSQGQVFIQGDELVGVSLPSSASNSFAVTNTDSQFVSTSPVIQGNNASIGTTGTSTRLIIQPNQLSSGNISGHLISTNSGHYLIHVGNSPTVSSNSTLSISNRGHIIIKSGVSKAKPDPLAKPPNDGVVRVIIPEGTTKLPKPSYPIKVDSSNDEGIRKHVQINLSNRSAYQPSKPEDNLRVDNEMTPKLPLTDKQYAQPVRKLYECINCSSKFMKPLYLRMHMRSCKKLESKPEKIPLYLCSFCKINLKTKDLIDAHFMKCPKFPKRLNEDSEVNNTVKKGRFADIDPTLDQAIQYKCQDCDRTFNKERQYTSHIKKCTKVSVHDLTGVKAEPVIESLLDDDPESSDDPFADPPPVASSNRRGRGGGRRGRPRGRTKNTAKKAAQKTDILFEGDNLNPTSTGLIVADNENLVRSTTGLAHTVQLTLETAQLENQPQPTALVTDSKGVRGRERPPQAWSLVCSLCQKMYLTKIALSDHVIDNHGSDLKTMKEMLTWQCKEGKDLYRCPVCDLHYESGQQLLEHLVMLHALKLQECHKDLQCQHLSLEHLEELEKIKASAAYQRAKKEKEGTLADDVMKSEEFDAEQEVNLNSVLNDVKNDDENPLECRYCGEEFDYPDNLKSHYIYLHGVDTDQDGNLLDLGLDVDIRVKDTKTLIQLAEGRVSDSKLPVKTILIRKKPKQSWQCQNCKATFTRHVSWLTHVRESCPQSPPIADASKTPLSQRECRFYCMEAECSHLAFLQFKSLAKHKEEAHNVIVKKERKSFVNLPLFYQWLSGEEKKHDVRFIRDSTRLERNNVRLIQMVCHRFHSAKMDQSKEKDQNDLNKPTKKRWYVRIQRESKCYARIYIRVEYNESSKEYDGETQVIYYPEHFHNEADDPKASPVKDKLSDRPNDLFGENVENDSQLVDFSPTTSTTTTILSNASEVHPHTSFVVPSLTSDGLLAKNESNGESQFLVGQEPTTFMALDADEPINNDVESTADEEYVLPADEMEWTKLFDVLKIKISTGELSENERKEAQQLLSYRNLVSMTSLSQQVRIFQRVCSLTNIEP